MTLILNKANSTGNIGLSIAGARGGRGGWIGLGWVKASSDTRTHGQRPYLRDTTGPHNSRLSGLKARGTSGPGFGSSQLSPF